MPFLSTNQYGTGPLYQFGSNPSDNSAYLLAGVTYYQTSQVAANSYAIWMNLADCYLTVAGSIGSRSFGIRATGSGEADITVTSTGYVGGDIAAIQFSGPADARLVNDGMIVATSGSNSAVSANEAAGQLTIINTGTIIGGFLALSLGGEDDDIVNTGTIVGGVDLGGGDNSIDTHLGSLTGAIFGGAAGDRYTIAGTEEIREAVSGGYDRVTSYGDYRLATGLEDLTLMGAAHVGGGNALVNFIYATVEDCRLNGLGGDDTLTGSLGDDLLIGGTGNDELHGAEGDNLLHGGTGDDRLYAEADGTNSLFGGAGDDVLSAEDGTNTLIGGDGDDGFGSGAGSDSIRGGAGTDLVSYISSTAGVVVNLTTNVVSGGWATGDTLSGIEDVAGGQFDDKLTGSGGDNHLYGFGGGDALAGLDGDDRLEGGAGADQIDGGVGSDTVEYAFSAAAVTVNLGAARGAGGDATGDRYTSIENAVGSGGADTISGTDGVNTLRGGAGADTLNGGKGADTLFGDAGDDILSGGADADVFAFPDVVPGAPGWGDDLVTIFQNGIDKISFVGSSAVHSFADVVFAQDGGDTVITVVDDSIRLAGFDATLLDASDFIFG